MPRGQNTAAKSSPWALSVMDAETEVLRASRIERRALPRQGRAGLRKHVWRRG